MTAQPDPAEVDATEVAEDHPDEAAPFGAPGLVWAGDGALSAGRAPVRSALDVAFEVYPPILEEGQDGFPLATFNRRWLGYVIDQVVITGCAILVSLLAGFASPDNAEPIQLAAVGALVRVGYGLIFNPRGWTPGKTVVGLRIVNEEGDPPGLRWGVVRTAGAVLSESAFYIGYLWAFFDERAQTWHDKFGKTYVVRAEDSEQVASSGWRRR